MYIWLHARTCGYEFVKCVTQELINFMFVPRWRTVWRTVIVIFMVVPRWRTVWRTVRHMAWRTVWRTVWRGAQCDK